MYVNIEKKKKKKIMSDTPHIWNSVIKVNGFTFRGGNAAMFIFLPSQWLSTLNSLSTRDTNK